MFNFSNYFKLTHDGKVKMADVGVGKYEGEITGTVCDTFLYIAPEVLEGRIYSSRADMYSFAFVLWELWYGERVFSDMEVSRNQSKFLQDVRDGLRPCHIEKTPKPSPSWKRVMESCWEKSPGKRMKASDALAVLKLLKNNSRSNVHVRPSTSVPPKKTVPSQRPRSCPQKPPVKPKRVLPSKPKSTKASVSYSSKSKELSLHLDSKDKP